MEARFEAYKRAVVQPFFMHLARGVDRQIVLVDVLRALNAGEEAFTDQRLALETILEAFRFGRRSPLRLLFGARIDRVLFAATKADHVPALQRDHLEALIANLVAVPTLRAEGACAGGGDGARLDPLHRGRHRCHRRPQGRCRDRLAAGRRAAHPLLPGIVPVTPPPAGFWGERFTEFPIFQPPRIAGAGGDGVPHINLDKALEFLLGRRSCTELPLIMLIFQKLVSRRIASPRNLARRS